MRLVAIDPGTSNTGLVYMDEFRVICCRTVKGKPVKQDQDALKQRAADIADVIIDWMADKPHEAVVVEGFTSFGGQHQSASTYQTPYLIGYLHAALGDEHIVIQTSKQVLNPRTRRNLAHVRDMAARGYEVFPESEKCTNDHLRAALCHGIYYLREQGEWRDAYAKRAHVDD